MVELGRTLSVPSTAHLLSQLTGDVVVVLQVVYWLHMPTNGHMEVAWCILLEVGNTVCRGWCADVAHCCGVVLATAVETRVADLWTHVQVAVLVEADTVDWHCVCVCVLGGYNGLRLLLRHLIILLWPPVGATGRGTSLLPSGAWLRPWSCGRWLLLQVLGYFHFLWPELLHTRDKFVLGLLCLGLLELGQLSLVHHELARFQTVEVGLGHVAT